MKKISARQIFLAVLTFFFLLNLFAPKNAYAASVTGGGATATGCVNLSEISCNSFTNHDSCLGIGAYATGLNNNSRGWACGDFVTNWGVSCLEDANCHWDGGTCYGGINGKTCREWFGHSFCTKTGGNGCSTYSLTTNSSSGTLYAQGCSVGGGTSCNATVGWAFTNPTDINQRVALAEVDSSGNLTTNNNWTELISVNDAFYNDVNRNTTVYNSGAINFWHYDTVNASGPQGHLVNAVLQCGKYYKVVRETFDTCNNFCQGKCGTYQSCGITDTTPIIQATGCPAAPPTCSFPSTSTVTTTINTATNYSASTTNSTSSNIYWAPQISPNVWSSAYPNPASISFSTAGNDWVVCNASGAGGSCTGNPWCNFNNVANSCVAGSRSVNAWIKTSASGSNQIIYSTWDGNNANGWQIYVNGAGYPAMWTGNGSTANPTKRVNDGAWHMITGILDGNNIYLYVDGGSAVSTSNVRPNPTTKDNQIGAECGGSGSTGCDSYFNGVIDEVGVWGRNLYPGDVSALYNGGVGRSFSSLSYVPGVNTNSGNAVPVSQFLISYWTLDGSTSDSLGTYNGTAVNTTTATGKIGNALNFNGGNSLVKIPTPTNINTNGCAACTGTDCGGASRLPVAVTTPPPTCSISLPTLANLNMISPTSEAVSANLSAQNTTSYNLFWDDDSGASWQAQWTYNTTNNTLLAVSPGEWGVGVEAHVSGPGGSGSCFSPIVPVTVDPGSVYFQTSGGDVWGNTIHNPNIPSGYTVNNGIIAAYNNFDIPAGREAILKLANYPNTTPITGKADYATLANNVAKNAGAGSINDVTANAACNSASTYSLNGYDFYCYDASSFDSQLTRAISAGGSNPKILVQKSNDAGFYTMNTARSITTAQTKIIVLVNGNLTVSKNISLPTTNTDSGLIFILQQNSLWGANGDLTINSSSVQNLDGIYLFPGSFADDNSNTYALTGRGSLLKTGTTGTFGFNRTYSAGPAENWIYEPKYLSLFQKILSRARFTWKELPPQ